MTEQLNMYKNPFSRWNADVYSDKELLEFWEKPIEWKHIKDSVYDEKKALFFIGPRGSGKTMISRYYSYDVQKTKAKESNKPLTRHFENIKGIGLYIRLDKWAISSMNGKNYSQEDWDKIFCWYKELYFCNALFEVIKDLEIEKCVKVEEVKKFISAFLSQNNISKQIANIEGFINLVEKSIEDINEFRQKITIENCSFKFSNNLAYKLSFKNIVHLSKQHIAFLKDKPYAIFLEQYEDYSIEQQKIINSLLIEDEFEGILFRICMRPGGLHTRATTVMGKEIERGKHFINIPTQNTKNFKDQKGFLERIANKRLQKLGNFNANFGIKQFLGSKQEFANDLKDFKADVKPEAKNKINYLEKVEEKEAVQKLIEGRDCSCNEMYKYGAYIYTAKNLIKSSGRIERLYYGFDVIANLSDGNIRYFLNVCERIFRSASFECKEEELIFKTANKQIQNKAVYETSLDELGNHRRITDVGENIYNMIVNMGNLLEKHQCHPENPSFGLRTIRFDGLDEASSDIIKYSLIWGVLLKKVESDNTSSYILGGSMVPLFGINPYINNNMLMKIAKEEFASLTTETNRSINISIAMKEDKENNIFSWEQYNDSEI